MNRRSFIHSTAMIAAGWSADSSLRDHRGVLRLSTAVPVPSAAQLAWQRDELAADHDSTFAVNA